MRKCHKSNGKVRCGVKNNLLNVGHSYASKFDYMQVQLIAKVSVQNDCYKKHNQKLHHAEYCNEK